MDSKVTIAKWFGFDAIAQYLPEVWMQVLAGVLLLFLLYRLVSWGIRFAFMEVLSRALKAVGKAQWLVPMQRFKLPDYISNAIPLAIITGNISLLPLSDTLSIAVTRVVAILTLVYFFLAASAVLSCFKEHYTHSEHSNKGSICGYIEVIRSVLWAVAAVLAISIFFDRSPLLMLSGLGAISAVLLLVFKDTLLSMVASAQMSSNDTLRIGDWIEMPQAHADGFVIDIALHTVKVQNFDKTVTTIPTYKLFSESYRNWRHMFESGGRRIKRTLRIDAASIRFLSEEEVHALRRFALLDEYLVAKQDDVVATNMRLREAGKDPINERRLSNIGTFRAYAMAYLKQKQGVHQDMLMMVRMMEPTSEGVPIEIYCFTDDTAWVNYEAVQGDIFDHFLSVLPELGLQLYQAPSGRDMQQAFTRQTPSAPIQS